MSQPTNAEIMERLDEIYQRLEVIVNPMSTITAEQKGKMLAEAYKSKDKGRIKATIKAINAR